MATGPKDVVHRASRRRESLAVAALLLVALLLRLYQVDWDQGHLYHPDERYILMTTAGINLSWPLNWSQLLSPQSTLDPHGFAYGSFAFYLLRLIAALLVGLGHLAPPFGFLVALNDLSNLRLIGRPISALFDTATVYIIYQIGKRLFGQRVAFLAAVFVTFSVIDIQLSHFYATDTIMTCLALAAILASLHYLHNGSTRSAVWAGVFSGLALATKVSSAPVLAPVGLAYILRLFTRETSSRGACLRVPSSDELSHTWSVLVRAMLAGAVAFIIAEPYAIIDFNTFVAGVTDQGNMVRGIVDLPYTRQFIGRPAYLYFLQILVLFGVGLPLGLSMIGGWLYMIVRAIRLPRAGELLLLSYVIPYFAITGNFYAKFMRYLLPITPLLELFAAVALVYLLDQLKIWRLGSELAVAGASEIPPPRRSSSVDDHAFDEVNETDRLLPELIEDLSGDDAAELLVLDGEVPGTLVKFASEPSPRTTSESSVSVRAAPPIDPEARRFAELKGLSIEWFVSGDQEETLARVPVSPAIDETSEDDWNDSVSAVLRPLPSWIRSRPRLEGLVRGRWPTVAARTVLAIVVGFSVFYALAFEHMYSTTSTPVEASLWLYQHAPPGSTIATEHWEEGLPVPIPTGNGVLSADSFRYHIVTMPMYDDDNQAKLTTIVNNLEAADYVVFFSNRLYGTIPRLPQRYPMSTRYYQELFGEKLGFKLVGAFDRYPNLLGVAFVDDTLNDPGLPTPPLLRQQSPAPITLNLGHADESFSVYDHQKVLIFQKTQRLSPDQLRALIGPAPAPDRGLSSGPASNFKPLVFTPAQEATVAAGGTFRDLFDRQDVFNHLPVLVWIVLIVLCGLAGLPLGFLVFRFLPDRGYLVSKTLGILVLAWLSWIIVSAGLTQATRPATLAIFGLYLLLGIVAAFFQRDEILKFLRTRGRLVVLEEGLFFAAFFYDLYIRALDPDLWHPTLGGEKPMDLAYFTAAAKSPIYPPYDPWFSGGYLNYYYFGQIIVGTLTRISGVLPTTSYNVVIPLLFALTVGGAFTSALALLHRGDGMPSRQAVGGGLLASILVCVVGNLGGFLQLLQQVAGASPVHLATQVPGVGTLVDFVAGAFEIIVGRQPFILNQDWYWSSTRALALLGLPGTGSINEFPYFTFLFADLHAHLIGLPLTLLALALCINVVKSHGLLAHLPETVVAAPAAGFVASPVVAGTSPSESPSPEGWRALSAGGSTARGTAIATILAAGLTFGALYPTNTWDYPTYLGLLALALAIPWYLSRRLALGGFVTLVLRLATIVILGRLLYQPFYASFQSFYTGVHPIDEKSEISWFFLINGLFVVVMVSYLLVQGWVLYRRTGLLRALRLYLTRWDLLPRVLILQRALVRRWDFREVAALYAVVWLAIIVAGAFAFGMALTGVLIVLLVASLAICLNRNRSPDDCLLVLLFSTGLALAIGTEQVAIDGDIGRMNTVFKFYEQIWVLWGVASAVAVVRIREWLGKIGPQWLRPTWTAVFVAFLLMTSVYPVLGTIARVSNRFSTNLAPTLDGMAYMDGAVYVDDNHPLHLKADKEAIIWLQDNVNGTPIILEGNRPIYRWGSRFSIYTGLPTVIGWDWHQTQQRWGYQDLVKERLNDVQTMYDNPSPDVTIAMLRAYHVTYVIDGELEQSFYPTARAKFDSMVGKYLSVVYDHDGVRIYQVLGS